MNKILNLGRGYGTYAIALCGLVWGGYQYFTTGEGLEIVWTALGLIGLRRAIQ